MKDPVEDFGAMALSFPHTEENPHHDRRAFKISGKRIFATLHEASNSANIRLTPEMQGEFIQHYEGIFAVDNKWGAQGWTTFELTKTSEEVVFAALESAYEQAKS